MKTQLAISTTGDLQEKEWTFTMLSNDFAIYAGQFIIMKKEQFDEIIETLEVINNYLSINGDTEREQELESKIILLLNKLELK